MPYAPGSIANFVKFGPGKLYTAAVGAAEPATLIDVWPVAWTKAGFTEEGNVFTYTPSYEGIEVAESLLPLSRIAVGQEASVEFAFAEMIARNLQIALNGATITASGTGATSIDSVEPLAFGAVEPRIAIGWEADDASERWIWRKCLQTGAVAIGRRKGAAKATLPVSFGLELVSDVIRPWKAILKSTATIT